MVEGEKRVRRLEIDRERSGETERKGHGTSDERNEERIES